MNSSTLMGLAVAVALTSVAARTQTTDAAPTTDPKRVLVVSVTTGYRHSAIPVGNRVLAELAKQSGKFTVDFVEQPTGTAPQEPKPPKPLSPDADEAARKEFTDRTAEYENALAKFKIARADWLGQQKRVLEKLSAENLKNYDAVIFNSTTGDLPLPDKDAFLKWIADGHGFVGIHAATDTFRGHTPLDPFVLMIGGEFKSHPSGTYDVECINEDPKNPATAHLGGTWKLNDEIYLLNGFDRATVHMLLKLDQHPKDKTPGYFPIAWCKKYGKGNVFYTALGHREDIWDAEWKDKDGKRINTPETAQAYQKQLLGGILWALGLSPGDATPQAASVQ